jgi:ABC-2 type transport system ATP-binding protein
MQLTIEKVSKKYGQFWALKDINLTLNRGVIGFLGPNGAGKTTLLRIISTLMKPDSGRVCWCGMNIADYGLEFRRVLGYLPQGFGYYPNFTVTQFLMYIGALKEIDKRELKRMIPEVLAQVALEDAPNKKMKALSGGMKQRVGIAQALLNNPQVLIVDEPSAGLDPEERMRFRNLLTDLAGERIVLLSTHIVSDLDAVANEIVLIKKGSIVRHSTPEELLETAAGKVWQISASKEEAEEIKRQYILSAASRKGNEHTMRVIGLDKPTPDAIAVEPNLEDAYLLYLSKDERAVAWGEQLTCR